MYKLCDLPPVNWLTASHTLELDTEDFLVCTTSLVGENLYILVNQLQTSLKRTTPSTDESSSTATAIDFTFIQNHVHAVAAMELQKRLPPETMENPSFCPVHATFPACSWNDAGAQQHHKKGSIIATQDGIIYLSAEEECDSTYSVPFEVITTLAAKKGVINMVIPIAEEQAQTVSALVSAALSPKTRKKATDHHYTFTNSSAATLIGVKSARKYRTVSLGGLSPADITFLQQLWVHHCYHISCGASAVRRDTEELFQFWTQWQFVDADADGFVYPPDLAASLCFNPPPAISNEFFSMFDNNNEGVIGFTSFFKPLLGTSAPVTEEKETLGGEHLIQADITMPTFGHPHWQLMIDVLFGIALAKNEVREKKKVRWNFGKSRKSEHRSGGVKWGMTHSKKTESRFVYYSPNLFAEVRAAFGVDEQFMFNQLLSIESLLKSFWTPCGDPPVLRPAAVLHSTGDEPLLMTMANGLFVIKEVPDHEARALQTLLSPYIHHVYQNKDTLLPRYYGLYSMYHYQTGKKFFYVLMQNIFFAATRPIARMYDLSGGTVGRSAPMFDSLQLDLNLNVELPEGFVLDDGSICQRLTQQLANDLEFLRENKMVNYTLAVGVHIGVVDSGNQEEEPEDELMKKLQHATGFKTVVRNTPSLEADGCGNKEEPDNLRYGSDLSAFHHMYGGCRAGEDVNGTEDENGHRHLVYYFGLRNTLITAQQLLKQTVVVPPPFYMSRMLESLTPKIRAITSDPARSSLTIEEENKL
eukprot:TRINITY_DN59620_c0_g1_i1.p1 TRINITY_DN59620_c0_g1~~TRINITY_DN59620_c0_g1_i1.p1  ORF type:complete len:843 (-),score=79.66 TRINITY_DN59620_c0_g1_i1:2017-4284(-)